MTTPPIAYQMQLDTALNGLFAGTYDDITQYVVGQVQWTNGMERSYDEVANPARMMFTLRNNGGEFDRERFLSGELVVNGGFDSWTADNPNGWTVSTESQAAFHFTEVIECGQNSIHNLQVSGSDNGGTGACNLYSDNLSTNISISQSVLIPGQTHLITLKVTRYPSDYVFASYYVGSGIILYDGSTAITSKISLPGTYSFLWNASNAGFKIEASAGSGAVVNITIDDVSIKPVPRYASLRKGMQVRLRSTYLRTTRQEFIGKIVDIQFVLGDNNEPQVNIVAEDAMLDLLDAEYIPPLQTAATVDSAITKMFVDGTVSRWPYSHSYWLLGIAGTSELDYTTYLYDQTSYVDFDTGITTLTYIGDVADKEGQGVSAQGYIRDLVQAEAGGRFWFDTHTGKFTFQNRNVDPANDTTSGSYTAADFDAVNYVYGQEIVNQYTLNYSERDIGSAGSIIWSYVNVPFIVKQDTTRVLTANYFDSTNTKRRIGAKDHIAPIIGTDYTANTAQDGSGSSVTNGISLGVDFGATGAKIAINNSSGADFYITLLQLRGTPMTQLDASVESLSGDSVRDNDLRPMTVDARLIDSQDLAQQFADYQVARFKTPLTRLESVTFNSLRSAAMMAASVQRLLSEKIRITLTDINHDAYYFVVGEMNTLTVGGDNPRDVTWILKPAQRDTFWVLGVTGKSELNSTTILSF